MKNEQMPSDMLSSFLTFIDQACREYHLASDEVGKEDKKVQDYIHMIEFAQDKAERNRNATALQRSRRYRRQQKDKTILYGEVVKFFEDPSNKKFLNSLKQLLGRQRKEEEYLKSDRVYHKRVIED